MEDDVETVAKLLGELYVRETEGRKVKWQHFAPVDRSHWRLIARVALDEIQPSWRLQPLLRALTGLRDKGVGTLSAAGR
jgi:hypothetical protein